MNLFVWTQTLATGNRYIDDEHRELVRLVNAVLEAIAAKTGAAGLADCVRDLQAYVGEHFAREDQEMQRIDYRYRHYHTEAHGILLQQLQDMHDKILAGADFEPMAMYNYLTWWVKDHIRLWDVPLAAALATPGDAIPRPGGIDWAAAASASGSGARPE